MRSLLLACGLLAGLSTEALAQEPAAVSTAGPLEMPNTEVHHIAARSGRSYELYVQLPPSYAVSDTVAYPVLYLTDAETELLGMFTGLQYFVQRWGGGREVILVAVADGDVDEHFRSLRRVDYTPTPVPPDSRTSGGAPEFLEFLREQAMPFIEGRYRANPADRGIWGHSLGGLFAAHALLDSPGTFHRYIISSPVLTYDDGLLVKNAAIHAAAHDTLPARVYSAFGADEPASDIEAWEDFFAELEAAGLADLRATAELVPEADHLTVMPIAFVRGLKAVYGLQPIAAVVDSAIAAGGIAEAKRLYQHLLSTEPQEYDFAEAQLNNLGYSLLGRNQVAEAIEVFRLNVERFPLSGNVYDSLGEGYMVAGDTERAIENYRRSLELDPGNTNAVEMLRKMGARP